MLEVVKKKKNVALGSCGVSIKYIACSHKKHISQKKRDREKKESASCLNLQDSEVAVCSFFALLLGVSPVTAAKICMRHDFMHSP